MASISLSTVTGHRQIQTTLVRSLHSTRGYVTSGLLASHQRYQPKNGSIPVHFMERVDHRFHHRPTPLWICYDLFPQRPRPTPLAIFWIFQVAQLVFGLLGPDYRLVRGPKRLVRQVFAKLAIACGAPGVLRSKPRGTPQLKTCWGILKGFRKKAWHMRHPKRSHRARSTNAEVGTRCVFLNPSKNHKK